MRSQSVDRLNAFQTLQMVSEDPAGDAKQGKSAQSHAAPLSKPFKRWPLLSCELHHSRLSPKPRPSGTSGEERRLCLLFLLLSRWVESAIDSSGQRST